MALVRKYICICKNVQEVHAHNAQHIHVFVHTWTHYTYIQTELRTTYIVERLAIAIAHAYMQFAAYTPYVLAAGYT